MRIRCMLTPAVIAALALAGSASAFAALGQGKYSSGRDLTPSDFDLEEVAICI